MLVYLAGPDVFLPDPLVMAARKRQICAEAGLQGIFPLDAPPDADASLGEQPDAARIASQNEAHIRRCSGVLANLTPFRGPGADAGTVYEVGYARALGKPVFGYTNAGLPYEARVRRWAGLADAAGVDRDRDGLEIERFGLADNLMVACGIGMSGGAVVAVDCTPQTQWTDLRAFRRCVALAAAALIPAGSRGGVQVGQRPGDPAPHG